MVQEKMGCHTDIQQVRLATHSGLSGLYTHELAAT